ncbi:MAG: hypothetical protein ACYS9X_16130, partial [Planctomycetota bacterium]
MGSLGRKQRTRRPTRGARVSLAGVSAVLLAASAHAAGAGAGPADVMHYVRTYHGRVIGVRRVTVREEGQRVRT